MALKRSLPPAHRADAPILYIHHDDSAWDKVRIKAEQERMKEAGENPADHPVARYHGGFTRYDLDARGTILGTQVVSPRDYLNETEKPLRFKLRRLSLPEWYEVQPLWESAVAAARQQNRAARPYECYLRCYALGVIKVDNGPDVDMPGNRLSLADMEKLRELEDGTTDSETGQPIDFALDVGRAVYQASMPLTEPEKKVSG